MVYSLLNIKVRVKGFILWGVQLIEFFMCSTKSENIQHMGHAKSLIYGLVKFNFCYKLFNIRKHKFWAIQKVWFTDLFNLKHFICSSILEKKNLWPCKKVQITGKSGSCCWIALYLNNVIFREAHILSLCWISMQQATPYFSPSSLKHWQCHGSMVR